MGLYTLWLVVGIVTIMIALLAIDRSMNKKKSKKNAVNSRPLPIVEAAKVVSMNKEKSA